MKKGLLCAAMVIGSISGQVSAAVANSVYVVNALSLKTELRRIGAYERVSSFVCRSNQKNQSQTQTALSLKGSYQNRINADNIAWYGLVSDISRSCRF